MKCSRTNRSAFSTSSSGTGRFSYHVWALSGQERHQFRDTCGQLQAEASYMTCFLPQASSSSLRSTVNAVSMLSVSPALQHNVLSSCQQRQSQCIHPIRRSFHEKDGRLHHGLSHMREVHRCGKSLHSAFLRNPRTHPKSPSWLDLSSDKADES